MQKGDAHNQRMRTGYKYWKAIQKVATTARLLDNVKFAMGG
jgi:hypothetical protein